MQNLEHSFFGICSRPPTVMEYDMSNLDNVNVRKIFLVDDPEDPYIGTQLAAANKNYVLHLLWNPESGKQVIRVFSRQSTRKAAPRFDIPLNPDTVVDFFQFPSMFFNIVIFRDERTLNVSAILEPSIVLSGKNSTLVQKLKDRAFKMKLYISTRY